VREYNGKLAALSIEDGSKLWESPYMPNLESAPGELYINGGKVWLGPDFAEARDLKTGKVSSKLRGVMERVWTYGHHHRCYPGKATARYVITGKRGIEMMDMVGDEHSRNNWARGTCRVGVLPCNGLIYASPHSCGCYMEAMLRGFWALAGERPLPGAAKAAEPTSAVRLERGPAFGSPSKPAGKPGWPTYRCDAARSGSTTTALPGKLVPKWNVQLGGRLSAPTVAGGMVFVAQVDAHTVYALEMATGKSRWQFTTGGRVDSPPTYHDGFVLFGSADGWVYCLRAEDGVLRWRFRAALGVGRAVAYEQVESLWPAHGSVVIHEGIAYVAAGRSSYLDGGIALYGLDPTTGEVRAHRQLVSKHVGAMNPPDNAEELKKKKAQNWSDYKTTLAPDRSDSFSMAGARSDILTSEGGSVFLRQLRFDGKLAPVKEKRPHLFSTSDFLDSTEHHRCYFVLGTGDFRNLNVAYPWIVQKSLHAPYGLLMVFSGKTVWGVHKDGRKRGAQKCSLYAMARPDPDDAANTKPDFEKGATVLKPRWEKELPLGARAMIRAGDVLAISGVKGGPGQALQDAVRSGTLLLVSAKDGSIRQTMPLKTAPVWDGMASAGGKLFVADHDGRVLCLE
jgi:outer membrane protein assembly factor BamB